MLITAACARDETTEPVSEASTPTATAVASPTPTAVPTLTPEPEPTPSEEELRATATANQEQHENQLLDHAGISHSTFVELFIKPDIARERIRDMLSEDVPPRTEQVHAAHILVATEEAALTIYDDLIENELEFSEAAEEHSTDTQTAPNGGDLGWFPRGVMVPEFDEVVFNLETDEVSEPFQSEFGWHIATVRERDDDRPVELNVLNQLRQRAFQAWLEERRAEAEIDTRGIELPADPAMAPTQFQPPASAPQPPQPEAPPEMDEDLFEPGDPQDDIFDGEDPFEQIEDDDN
jgi:hypothetical protein